MSIEIIPAGASAVVMEKERDYGSKHPDSWDLSTQMQRDLNQVTGQAEKEFIELTNQGERGATASALASSLTDSKVQSSELNTQKAVDYGFRETMLRGDSHSERSQKQVSDFHTDTVLGFKDAQGTAYQLQSQVILDAAKNAAALSVQSQRESDDLSNQATNNFNLSAVQATANFNAITTQANLLQYNILLDAQKNASAAVLQAQQIAAAAAAKAAECCCELKTAITFDGQKTRDLINSITEQNLRDRAQRAETALASYYAAKTAPTSPVAG